MSVVLTEVPKNNFDEPEIVDPHQYDPIYLTGTPEERERIKPLIAKLEEQLQKIAALTDAQRAEADKEFEKFEATFRENAMSYRNRSHG